MCMCVCVCARVCIYTRMRNDTGANHPKKMREPKHAAYMHTQTQARRHTERERERERENPRSVQMYVWKYTLYIYMHTYVNTLNAHTCKYIHQMYVYVT